jgi:hypothetical protein
MDRLFMLSIGVIVYLYVAKDGDAYADSILCPEWDWRVWMQYGEKAV